LYDYGKYEARGRAYSEGGGNVTVGVPSVTWLRVLACGLVGGVERQNSNICTNRTFCKYPLLSLALYR